MTKHTSLGTEAEFFKKLRGGSRTKQKIVSDYFIYYNRVMAPRHPKVGYADLFAGPGVYTGDDGASHKSIPPLVCEATIGSELFRNKVHLWFNEGDRDNYGQLRTVVESMPGLDTLRYPPRVDNKIIDSSWVERLSKLRAPTLFFLDPCGYKGLSLRLVASALAGYGSDCIFFLNYSRINMKLDLDVMTESINEFFEPERARALRQAIDGLGPDEREKTILDAVGAAIREAKGIPHFFKFKSDRNRTSHHLVFASKSPKGAEGMKRIFNAASSTIVEGVGSGEYDPRASDTTLSLFAGTYEVEQRLLEAFGGRRIQFSALLLAESDTRFTESNYRDALLNLEDEGRIIVEPPAAERRLQAGGVKRTLPKDSYIQFGKGKADGH